MADRTAPVAEVVGLTVLALLVERPSHPYEMQRLIRQRRKDHAAGSPRSLYRAVDRLVREGLVEPVETGRAGNRPERTVYRITAEGREHLDDQLTDLVSVPSADPPVFAAAVSLLAHLSPPAAADALRTRVTLLGGQIAALEAQLTELRDRLHRILLVEVEYLLAVRRAELAWTRSLRDDIAAGTLQWDLAALLADPKGVPGP